MKKLQPGRKDVDVFPVTYRLNTSGAIRELFPAERWQNCSYFWNGDPAYHAERRLIWFFIETIYRFLPGFLSTSFFIFLRKKERSMPSPNQE